MKAIRTSTWWHRKRIPAFCFPPTSMASQSTARQGRRQCYHIPNGTQLSSLLLVCEEIWTDLEPLQLWWDARDKAREKSLPCVKMQQSVEETSFLFYRQVTGARPPRRRLLKTFIQRLVWITEHLVVGNETDMQIGCRQVSLARHHLFIPSGMSRC
jgi:hypothetical protein